jgi:hypothetical protein
MGKKISLFVQMFLGLGIELLYVLGKSDKDIFDIILDKRSINFLRLCFKILVILVTALESYPLSPLPYPSAQ